MGRGEGRREVGGGKGVGVVKWIGDRREGLVWRRRVVGMELREGWEVVRDVERNGGGDGRGRVGRVGKDVDEIEGRGGFE